MEANVKIKEWHETKNGAMIYCEDIKTKEIISGECLACYSCYLSAKNCYSLKLSAHVIYHTTKAGNTYFDYVWDGIKSDREFILTDRDKSLIEKWGYRKENSWYIERKINEGKYETGKRKEIFWQTALRILGRKNFLGGACRAAFHGDACQTNDKDGRRVYLDFR